MQTLKYRDFVYVTVASSVSASRSHEGRESNAAFDGGKTVARDHSLAWRMAAVQHPHTGTEFAKRLIREDGKGKRELKGAQILRPPRRMRGLTKYIRGPTGRHQNDIRKEWARASIQRCAESSTRACVKGVTHSFEGTCESQL